VAGTPATRAATMRRMRLHMLPSDRLTRMEWT